MSRVFNLKRAMAGDPVVTKSGLKVRIIAFDKVGTEYPIVALVKEMCGFETIDTYTIFGRFNGQCKSERDLVMVEGGENE